jgi:hypothetical protein
MSAWGYIRRRLGLLVLISRNILLVSNRMGLHCYPSHSSHLSRSVSMVHRGELGENVTETHGLYEVNLSHPITQTLGYHIFWLPLSFYLKIVHDKSHSLAYSHFYIFIIAT